jgi:type IV secretory pathway VirB10-like protein
VSVSREKPRAGSAEPWAQAVEADEASFPPVAEFGLRGGDPDLAAMDETEDPRGLERQRALMSPAARQRRARFAKYVAAAMGVSLVVLAAAVLKTSRPAAPSESTAKVARAGPAPAPSRAVSPAPESAAPEPVRAEATPAPPPAPPTAEVLVEPQPSSSAVAVASSSPAPPVPAAPPAGATKEREASRFALERGDLGTAVAAGERSVALDPSDGEAWLVLGAAYQARGELAQAKRCYRACVEQGSRGPKAECRAMAQGE